MEFRAGTVDDAERIADYHHRCWIDAFAPLLEPGASEQSEPSMWLDLFRERLHPQSSMGTVVAVDDGRVVGHVTVDGCHLVHLFVDPDHQGEGVGRRLLAIGEGLIAENGHATAELHTRVGNERAVELYTSAGWQLTDRLVHSAHDSVEYDEHVLVKRLGDE